jgi:GH25 family lysozyme M1 (1,4-beta-N-acetylmuramidase)
MAVGDAIEQTEQIEQAEEASSNPDEIATPPEVPVPTGPLRPTPFDSHKYGPEKYAKAWSAPATSIVIDAYQGNSIDWNQMATDKRVVGVIHRSSIGLTVDTKYQERKKIALERGYLWGAYHLGKPGDPIAQAQLFLKTAGTEPETLLILDLEDTSSPKMMSIDGAVKFMEYVYQQTGRIPVIYANHNVTLALNKSLIGHPLFSKTKLWYARFRPEIPDFPRGIWSTYFLWQFSSEINCSKTGTCLYNVPGTLYDMDVNVFFGTREALASQWL